MIVGRCLAGLILVLSLEHLALTEDSTDSSDAAGIAFFEKKVRPVLVEHCYDCHSAESGIAEGSLLLDTRAGTRAGGDRGPSVVPTDPDASLLLTAVLHADSDLKMPPKQKQLPKEVIADLRTWIQMGAPDPREHAKDDTPKKWAALEAAKDFWAYQPVTDPPVPSQGDQDWARRELDEFIYQALASNGLAPSPDAEPRVILRRLHFDLVGLPPSPEALERFLARVETSGLDSAIAEEADVLLASPTFGERWGRHWLDVARFAESSGGEANISFPYAFRFRDYVFDCFNADMPFDRFLTEQIAGDLLPYENEAERARLLVATGYLALGSKNLDAVVEKQFFADLVDEQIDTVTRSILASSVACARCHDHKFDPFSMQDYYALAGIFESTKTYFGTAVSPANRIGGDPLPLPRLEDQQIFHASIPAKKVAELKKQLVDLEEEKNRKQAAFWKAVAEGKDASEIYTITDALRYFWTTGGIEGQLEKVDENGKALPLAMGVLDREKPHDALLLSKGDILKPTDPVPRGFPKAINGSDTSTVPGDQSGRLELAQWLTDSKNPLTSRVIVNRIWHHLFGAGLVRTVDNFGSTGELPSHPELLDHLASRFMQNKWSTKQMVREIVTSRTYRQSSDYNETVFLADPENRLLWRASKRRFEAEAIRDAMLAASGELELARAEGSLVAKTIGDRPISLIGLDKRLPTDLDGSVNRSVYLPVLRDRLPEVLEIFDFADPSLVVGSRETTNVPTQSLYLMNSTFVQERSDAMATRLLQECHDEPSRVDRAFLLCFGRQPDSIEKSRATEFLAQDSATSTESESLVLAQFCQALLSTAEFRNLD